MIHILTNSEAGVVYTKPWMVALILDIAGYTSNRDLAKMVIVEPSAGDGAFLHEMVRRLVASCRQNGRPLVETIEAIRAYEISPDAVHRAVGLVTQTLNDLDVPESLAASLARSWIKEADFLEASLGFPVADFVAGNPPYIRLEEIPAAKAAFYRSFSTMRGRADIYIAFHQAALQQLKPGGVCAFICADRWMLNDYGSGLREFITTQGYNVSTVIEADDVAAFESEVSAYPAVTVIAREQQGPVIVAKALPGIETSSRPDLPGPSFRPKKSHYPRGIAPRRACTGDALRKQTGDSRSDETCRQAPPNRVHPSFSSAIALAAVRFSTPSFM